MFILIFNSFLFFKDEKPLLEIEYDKESNSLPHLVVNNEDLLSQRFASKKYKFQKPHFTPLDIKIKYSKNKSKFIAVNYEKHFKKLNKLIDLYNSLLTNYLVPNISIEIKFILNVYEKLSEKNDFSITKVKKNSFDGFLSSEEEWNHFCTSILLKQEHLISKLECNVLNFVVRRMSLFTSEIPASYINIDKDIVSITYFIVY